MFGMDDLVPFARIGMSQQMKQVARAAAADDTVGIDTEMGADRLAQMGRSAVGLAEDIPGRRLVGLHGPRAGAQGAFV